MKGRILRFVPMVIVLGLLVHVLLPRLDTIAASLTTMRSMRRVPMMLALLMEAMSYLANGNVLRSVIELAGERLRIRRAVAIELGAGSVAIVAAGALGFGASIFRWTRSGGISKNTAMLASWLPSVFDSAALILFALAGAIELLVTHKLARTTLVAVSIVMSGLAMIIVGILLLLARSGWLLSLATWASRLIKRLRPSANAESIVDAARRAAETWQSIRSGGWWQPMASAILVLSFDLLCLRFAFVATGHQVSFHLLLAGYGVPILLGRASFIPGGVAVIEVAMASLFAGLGLPMSAAVVAVLSYRILSFWLPALIGIPIAVTLQARRKKVVAPS